MCVDLNNEQNSGGESFRDVGATCSPHISSQISMNLIRLVSVLDIFSAITKRFIRFSQRYQLFLFPLKI